MIGEVSNHLWQSTLFVVAAGLLTIALRRNQARIRYWLWFSASVKFLVPFTLLMTFGSQLEWAPAAQQITPPAISSAMGQISQPFGDFSSEAESAAPSTRSDAGALTILVLLWLSGAMALAVIRFRLWRRVRAVVRASTPCNLAGIPPGVAARSAPGLMGPGIVGWWRPVLLVPRDIEQHLTARQLEAVLAHELSHVRRHGNLTSAVHMVVETVFWFHPLVWWIGARLIEERERACDEEVLRLGGDPKSYADGILNVCKRYAETPVACVSGVSGANLRRRIEAIMTNRVGRRLNVATKAALAAAAMTVLTLPVVAGAMSQAVPQAVWTPAAGAPKGLLSPLEGQRHDHFIARAQAGDIDIVFFGTTATEMWMWQDRGRKVWDQTFGSLKAASFGSQGTRVTSLLWRMQNGELHGYQAKLVVLQLPGTGAEAIAITNYAPIIAEIRARQPQARILIFAPFPRGNVSREAWRRMASANAASAAKFVDAKTIFYIDIGERFFRPDGSHNQEMWTMSGPPNAGMQEPAFKVWAEELQPWIDRFVR